MPRPDAGDPLADDTLHRLITHESEWRKIPLAALARASLLAASESRFAIISDGALGPNCREQLRHLAAVVELQRDWGWWHKEPWSQLKLLRTKTADYLAWLNHYLAWLSDSGALSRWLEDRPSADSMRSKPDRETREVNRRAWIKRFAEHQRRLREWISVPDLTDWCGQSTTTAGVAEQAKSRDLALELFADSILKAEFEREGRSKILFLSSRVTGRGSIPCRLKRESFERQWRYAAKMTPAPPLPLEVLACCWLPRELARQWIESHGYRWPPHLDPEKPPAVLESGENLHGKPLGKPEPDRHVVRRPSREKPFWLQARKAAFEWLDEEGFPSTGDGGQAKLEAHIADWLADRSHKAAESTIRKHVKAWIEEYKASLSNPE